MDDYKIVGVGNVLLQRDHSERFEDDLDPAVKDLIETTWSRAVSDSKGKLFDGTLLNYKSVEFLKSQIVVKGNFISYKYFWAKRNMPELNLKITPVGVSAMLLTKNRDGNFVTFATRTSSNLQYQGYFELIPSGSINDQGGGGDIDYYNQLMIELQEEVGLNTKQVDRTYSLGLLLDTRDNVFDVVCVLETKIDKNELQAMMTISHEYTNPKFIAVEKLYKFVADNKGNIVPASIGLIEMFTQINNFNN